MRRQTTRCLCGRRAATFDRRFCWSMVTSGSQSLGFASSLPPDSLAVSQRVEGVSGSVVTIAGDGVVDRLILDSERDGVPAERQQWKTVNATSISMATWSDHLGPELGRVVESGSTHLFYEAAFRAPIAAGDIRLQAHELADGDWAVNTLSRHSRSVRSRCTPALLTMSWHAPHRLEDSSSSRS